MSGALQLYGAGAAEFSGGDRGLHLAGGGGGFDPGSIDGLVGWWAADQIEGLSDGDPVATWPDQSGDGRDLTQGTGADKPLYQTNEVNGLPAVEFVSTDFLESAAALTLKPVTVLAVIEPADGAERTVVGSRDAGGLVYRLGAADQQQLVKSNTADIAGSSGAVDNDVWGVAAVTYSGSGVYAFYDDGIAEGAGTADHAIGSSRFKIGADLGGAGFVGKIAEVLVYDSALSTEDRQAVESYLMEKYGL